MAIDIDIPRQLLTLTLATESSTGAIEHQCIKRQWPISSGAKGVGQQTGSWQTPLGKHIIRARIGDGLPSRAVFRARRYTGEIWTPERHDQFPGRDWILGRILWLCGTEPGFNRLGDVDSQRRYIYIHGTPDSEPMGIAASHGCIRMHCDDLLALFSLTAPGMVINIHE